MATSGTYTSRLKTYTDTSRYIDAEFTWERISYSRPDLTSTISWTLNLRATNISSSGFMIQLGLMSANVNGTTYSKDFQKAIVTDAFSNGPIIKLISGTTTIVHDKDGSKNFNFTYNIRVDFNAMGNLTHYSGSELFVLDGFDLPAELLTFSDFTDESNPTITYSNPNGSYMSKLQVTLILGPNVLTGPIDLDKNGSSYTFSLSEAERIKIRNYFTTTSSYTSVRCNLRYESNTESGNSSKNATITLINHLPTLDPSVHATDARTKELTGDANGGILIKGVSDVEFNTGAVTRKGASIDHHKITNGSVTLDDYTSTTGTIENVDSQTFYFYLRDSRGNTVNDFVNFSIDNGKFIEYVLPTCKLNAEDLTADGELPFNIKGMYFNGSFGAVSNSMDIEYTVSDKNGNYLTFDSTGNAIKTEGGSYVYGSEGSERQRLIGVSPNITGLNTYSYSHTLKGLDHDDTYTLSVVVVDEITSSQTSSDITAQLPIFDWGPDDFRFNTDVVLSNNKKISGIATDGSSLVDVLVPCDTENSIVIGNENTKLKIKAESMEINDNPTDFIIDYANVDEGWSYRKWNSGMIELWRKFTIDIPVNSALGGWYRTGVISMSKYPFPFYLDNPTTTTSFESDGYSALVWATKETSSSAPPDYYLIRPTSGTAKGSLFLHVVDLPVQNTAITSGGHTGGDNT